MADVITFKREQRGRLRSGRDAEPPRDEHPIFEKLRRLERLNPRTLKSMLNILEGLVDCYLRDALGIPKPSR